VIILFRYFCSYSCSQLSKWHL